MRDLRGRRGEICQRFASACNKQEKKDPKDRIDTWVRDVLHESPDLAATPAKHREARCWFTAMFAEGPFSAPFSNATRVALSRTTPEDEEGDQASGMLVRGLTLPVPSAAEAAAAESPTICIARWVQTKASLHCAGRRERSERHALSSGMRHRVSLR